MDKDKPRPQFLNDNRERAKRSRKHEERIAEKLGGKRLPASGALRPSYRKAETECGDITSKDFFIEHKRTVKQSISIKKDWLSKVTDGANRHQKEPALVVTFEEKMKPPEDWVMIPMELFERLRAVLDEE